MYICLFFETIVQIMSKNLDIQRIKITNKGRNTLCDRLTRTAGGKCGKEEEEVRETATPRRREKPGRGAGAGKRGIVTRRCSCAGCRNGAS